MNELQIKLEKTTFFPGEEIRGTLNFRLEGNPSGIEARLFWHTKGKGDEDVVIVDTHRVETPVSVGHSAFRFTLPQLPYSFSGKLISLIWGVEAVVDGDSLSSLQEVIVSPTGAEIDLGKYPGEVGESSRTAFEKLL